MTPNEPHDGFDWEDFDTESEASEPLTAETATAVAEPAAPSADAPADPAPQRRVTPEPWEDWGSWDDFSRGQPVTITTEDGKSVRAEVTTLDRGPTAGFVKAPLRPESEPAPKPDPIRVQRGKLVRDPSGKLIAQANEAQQPVLSIDGGSGFLRAVWGTGRLRDNNMEYFGGGEPQAIHDGGSIDRTPVRNWIADLASVLDIDVIAINGYACESKAGREPTDAVIAATSKLATDTGAMVVLAR